MDIIDILIFFVNRLKWKYKSHIWDNKNFIFYRDVFVLLGGKMTISLDEMAAFVEVVDNGNFSRASEKTGIPMSTISRRVADLEKRLNTQLLYRTTRKQRLTDIGKVYFYHCKQMLSEAEAAELAIQNLKAEPMGTLRVTTPYVLEDPFASKMMASFLQRFPKINVDYIVSQRKVDLIEEMFDCALIPGYLNDSSLRTKGLGAFQSVYCASPSYIEQFGKPELETISQHQLVKMIYPDWMIIPEHEKDKELNCRLSTNDIYVARRSAVGGIGITCLPKVFVNTQIESGSLEVVLPELSLETPFNLVFPGNKHYTTKLRAFIDHMSEYSEKFAPWRTVN